MKKVLAVILVTLMMVTFTGCGSSLDGTYVNEESGNTFVFEKDGTCNYQQGSRSYTGTWSKEDDSYKIILEGISCTLYGDISDEKIVVSSDSSGWTNESFSKQ